MSARVEAEPNVGRQKPTRSLGKCQTPNLHIPTTYSHTLFWCASFSASHTETSVSLLLHRLGFGLVVVVFFVVVVWGVG